MNETQLLQYEKKSLKDWNFEALKKQLEEGLEQYKNRVYTDESIAVAKSDKQSLRKLERLIDDARKQFRRKCLEPYTQLEPQIKELMQMIDDGKESADNFVEDYDNRLRAEKEKEVRAYYDQKAFVLGEKYAALLYDKLKKPSWTNKSTSKKTYQTEILDAIHQCEKDFDEIKSWNSPHEVKLKEEYAKTLSLEETKKKKEEWETVCADLQDGAAYAAASKVIEQKREIKENGLTDGVLLKLYVDNRKMNQICEWLDYEGVRYEVL